eukprot:10055-Eustigmatos_ZCMA.PRE.1
MSLACCQDACSSDPSFEDGGRSPPRSLHLYVRYSSWWWFVFGRMRAVRRVGDRLSRTLDDDNDSR